MIFIQEQAARALPRMRSVADVAEMFGRAPRTIRSWIARGLLTPVKVGNAVFIPQDQIDRLLVPLEDTKHATNPDHKSARHTKPHADESKSTT